VKSFLIVVALFGALLAAFGGVSARAQAIVFAVSLVAFGAAFRDVHLGLLHGLASGGSQAPVTYAPARGRPDGSDHPAVGLLYGESGAASCSGALGRSRGYGVVFLTAAHCQLHLSGSSGVAVLVTFAPAPTEATTPVQGTFYADPAWTYPHHPNAVDTHDLAVVLFGPATQKLKTIQPMQLAPLASARSLLSYGSRMTVVGYGRTDPNKPASAGIRHEGTMAVIGINDWYVTTSPATTLACKGDSGGPELLTIGGKAYVAAVTSFGDVNCDVYTAGYRVDTAEARAFINGPHPRSS
jgi:hypothetical protein